MPFVLRQRMTRRVLASPALFLLVFLQHMHCVSAFYQRCLNERSTNLTVQEMQNRWISSCIPCVEEDPAALAAAGIEEEPPLMHVAIQLTNPKLQAEFVSIASGLLAENVNVTVFYMNYFRNLREDFHHILGDQISSGVPCAQERHIRPTFSIQAISVPPTVRHLCSHRLNTSTYFADPLQTCTVVMALSQYRAHTHVFMDDRNNHFKIPDVILTDFHGFGALLFAENFGIPSIVLGDEESFYATIGHEQKKLSLLQSFASIPSEILRSLKSLRPFVDLNRIRGMANLERIRHLSASWNTATALVVIASRHNSPTLPEQTGNYPPMINLKSPILPPCLVCIDHGVVTRKTAVAIFLIPAGFTIAETREVLRGLSAARTSLQSYDNAQCGSKKLNCWRGPADMNVKLLVNTDMKDYAMRVPDLLPPYVRMQGATYFVDSVLHAVHGARNNGSTVVIANCNDDARVALLQRVPTICLPASRKNYPYFPEKSSNRTPVHYLHDVKSTEIAIQVLRFLRKPRQSVGPNMLPYYGHAEGDSFERVLTTLLALGSLVPKPVVTDVARYDSPVSAKELQQMYITKMESKGVEFVAVSPPEPRKQFEAVSRCAAVLLSFFLFFLVYQWIFPAGVRPGRELLRRPHKNVLIRSLQPLMAQLPDIGAARVALARLWNDRDRLRLRKKRQESSNAATQNHRAVHHRTAGGKGTHSSQRKRLGKHR